MNKLLLATIGVLATAALVAAPAAADEKKAAAKDKAVKGEILDLACYIGHGASGPGHAECAASCLKGGQPMGLLGSDGTVYVLMADHMDSAPYEKAKEFAGKKVEVTGAPSSRGSRRASPVQGDSARRS